MQLGASAVATAKEEHRALKSDIGKAAYRGLRAEIREWCVEFAKTSKDMQALLEAEGLEGREPSIVP